MPDYTYYRDTYLGEDIPEAEFPRFAQRAADELAYMRDVYAVAPRKGLDPDEAENMALCAVADLRRPAGAVRHHAEPARRALPARGGVLSADRAVAAPCVKAACMPRP